jgi:hypothetical protein
MAKLVGLYLEAGTIQRDPGYLSALQADVGLTLISVSGAVQLSDAVLRTNPLGNGDRKPRLLDLVTRRLDGTPVASRKLATTPRFVRQSPSAASAALPSGSR